MSQVTSHPLSDAIEGVVRNASNQMEAFDKSQLVRQQIPVALKVMLAVPVVAVFAQGMRWYFGFASTPIIPWSGWAILTLLLPLGWVAVRALASQFHIDRLRAIRAADQQLSSSDRLETADHFLRQSEQDGFMQAAIEDAEQWAAKGQALDLTDSPQSNAGSIWWPVPVAALILLLSFGLMQLERSFAAATPDLANASGENPATAIDTTPTQKRGKAEPEPKEEPEKPPATKPDDRSDKAVNRQGSAGSSIPDTAEESSGKLSEGETRESQQSANPSNAKGSPSASGQPSKAGDEKKRKKKTPKKTESKEREKKERKEEEKPSGATAGQGSSKGSDNNAAPSDWASTSQSATPDDEDLDEEDEVDDEEEEQESRGGVQPNMRDRRTPVNRDLQIGFGNNRPNPDANGRGGPGGQKKSRGVASLVLGVPIPDRVNGQPNKGRIRITQQRITPETEISDPTTVSERPAKENAVGQLHHPEFTPWLHDYVRRFFLQQRAKYPLNRNTDSSESNASSDASAGINESNLPAS
ncbi:MAG: hypothetical protein AAF394_01915 [Planctomycetota bacterium]